MGIWRIGAAVILTAALVAAVRVRHVRLNRSAWSMQRTSLLTSSGSAPLTN